MKAFTFIALFLLLFSMDGCSVQKQTVQEPVAPWHTVIKVPPLPFKVVHGDFNRDGREDFAVITKANVLTIFLNTGDSSFLNSQTYMTNVNNTSAAVADFDQDGNPDIAMLTENCVCPIFLGDGKGGFKPHEIRLQGPGRGMYIDTADLNNDGLPDLYAAGIGNVSIYINKGGLEFETYRFSLGAEFLTRNISAVDLKGDGYKDLIFPDYAAGRLYVIANDSGRFSEPRVVYETRQDTISATVPIKINGRQLIVISLEHSGKIVVLDSAFNETTSIATPPYPYSLAVTDMNKDGYDDIVITHAPGTEPSGRVTILFGPSFKKGWEYRTGGLLYSSATIDWNLDGLPDLFLTDFLNHTVIFIPSPVFRQ